MQDLGEFLLEPVLSIDIDFFKKKLTVSIGIRNCLLFVFFFFLGGGGGVGCYF